MSYQNDRPVVSVVIPTFNRGASLLRAIESVLQQTYKSYEIIVVDDGSTNGTPAMLEPLLDRIRYLYQDNRGVSQARNRGIEAARGKWIATLDSDDLWFPRKLELQIERLGKSGSDVGVCFTNCILASRPAKAPTLFDDAGFRAEEGGGVLDRPIEQIFFREHLAHTSSLVIARELIVGNDGFDPQLRVAEDTDLLFRLSLKTRFCFVSVPLVCVNDSSSAVGGRLTDHFKDRGAVGFNSNLQMYNKWLLLTNNDRELSERIREIRRELCTDQLAFTLKRGRWGESMRTLGRMIQLESSLYVPLVSLARRATRYLVRKCK